MKDDGKVGRDCAGDGRKRARDSRQSCDSLASGWMMRHRGPFEGFHTLTAPHLSTPIFPRHCCSRYLRPTFHLYFIRRRRRWQPATKRNVE